MCVWHFPFLNLLIWSFLPPVPPNEGSLWLMIETSHVTTEMLRSQSWRVSARTYNLITHTKPQWKSSCFICTVLWTNPFSYHQHGHVLFVTTGIIIMSRIWISVQTKGLSGSVSFNCAQNMIQKSVMDFCVGHHKVPEITAVSKMFITPTNATNSHLNTSKMFTACQWTQ